MNKDFLVVLLQKDIRELSLLTEGFEKMNEFPEPLLRLAKQKAENIRESLESLGNPAPSELGEIDYQSFADLKNEITEQDTPKKNIFTEKNNFDAPLDYGQELIQPDETETDIEEVFPEMNEAEKNEKYIETEHQLDVATAKTEQETDGGFPNNMDEEFQEEIEVEEIGENEQVLVYEKTDIPAGITGNVPKEPTTEAKIDLVNDRPNAGNVTLNDSLYKQESSSLSDSLANQKIDDIRQAMNIGDRFRFQRELFGSNGEVMNKTITYLNQLAKYDEAASYLKSKFGWSDDNPHVEEFMQIIKRRYY